MFEFVGDFGVGGGVGDGCVCGVDLGGGCAGAVVVAAGVSDRVSFRVVSVFDADPGLVGGAERAGIYRGV